MLRMPSMKSLVSDLDLSRADATLIRAIGHAVYDVEKLSALLASDTRTAGLARDIDRGLNDGWRRTYALRAMDAILGTHGVEAIVVPGNESCMYAPWEYLNAGDGYAATLVYHHHARAIRIGCWADVVEGNPLFETAE